MTLYLSLSLFLPPSFSPSLFPVCPEAAVRVLCPSHLFLYIQLLSSVEVPNMLNDAVKVLQEDLHVTHQCMQIMLTARVTLASCQVTQELTAIWQRLNCNLQPKRNFHQCSS